MGYEATGPVKSAAISAIATGGTLIAAVPTKRLRVLSFCLTLSAAGTVRFDSNATPLTGAIAMAINAPLAPAECQAGQFTAATGEALNVTIAGGGNVNGYIVYQEIQ